MIGSGGVIVSLPAREIAGMRLPGSLFSIASLSLPKLSLDLRGAINLVVEMTGSLGLPLMFVSRPEIFTHGETLRWLNHRVGGARDHLCVSDGSTVKLIPGMRNHVFLYALERESDSEALCRLERRTPELFSGISNQVNTALRFGNDRRRYTPSTLVIPARETAIPLGGEFYRFFLNPHSISDSIARIMLAGRVDSLEEAQQVLLYVPMTETSIRDAHFIRLIACCVTRFYLGRSATLIMRLPSGANSADDIVRRVTLVLEAFQKLGTPFPGRPAHNIFFLSDNLHPKQISFWRTRQILVHDSFSFWHLSPSYYKLFNMFRVSARHGRHDLGAFLAMISELTERQPEVIWPSLDLDLDSTPWNNAVEYII